MAFAKIVQDGTTLIDLTQDTVTAGSMLSGVTAHKNDGTSVTGTITSQAAQTITPTTTDQTIASGKYLTGNQTIKGDANLIAENIAKDVTIFGVTGTHEGGGGGGNVTVEFIYNGNVYTNLIAPAGSVVSNVEYDPDVGYSHQTVTAPANSLVVGYFFISSAPPGPYMGPPTGTNVSVSVVQVSMGSARSGTIIVDAFNLSDQDGIVNVW